MNKGRPAIWLFDGFNLHHSIRQAESLDGQPLAWIDPVKLAANHLHALGEDSELGGVHYFSAIPHHLAARDPEPLAHHTAHLRALSALRPRCEIHLGHFQPRIGLEGRCWQEKGTDMAIATMAMRACLDHARLCLVIVSGDSDFAPLSELVAERWPTVDLRFAFPAHRSSRRLSQLRPLSFTLGTTAYAQAQLPERVRLPSGKFVACPTPWMRKCP